MQMAKKIIARKSLAPQQIPGVTRAGFLRALRIDETRLHQGQTGYRDSLIIEAVKSALPVPEVRLYPSRTLTRGDLRRLWAGRTAQELATLTGRSRSVVTRWLKGDPDTRLRLDIELIKRVEYRVLGLD